MKKILIFLITILCITLFPTKEVNAYTTSFYEGEYIRGIWMNKVKNGTKYYQTARFFRQSGTNNFAYCIEPFEMFNENSTYESTLSPNNLNEYQKQRIEYVEIADTTLTKKGLPAIELLEEVHEIMPKIEQETGVKIRFLVAIRRIPLTIVNDNITNGDYLRENINVLKTVSKSPYVVGCDFIGEEINDISELQPVINEIVQYVGNEDKGYTIRIHAGENDSLKDNVSNSIKCVKNSLKPGQEFPRVRIGHGLYTPNLDSKEGEQLIKDIKEAGAVMEFQITSNVRLNNLSKISKHPLKKYLRHGIKCVQGTDGCGFYGIDTIDEQLALQNFLGVKDEEFAKMRDVEDEIIKHSKGYFVEKSCEFAKFLNGRTIRDALLELEEKYEVSVFPLNCEQLRKEDVYAVLKGILYEFPVVKMNFFLPKWVEMLEMSHPIKENVVANAGKMLSEVTLIKDLMDYKMAPEGDYISNMMMQAVNLENGTADIRLDIADQYYYENISELTGTEVTGEYQLISMIKELSEKRKEYEKVADAVQSVEMKGYGVVSPKLSDIKMDDPVLIKHGNKFGVKIKAVAPSVHMIRANIETEIAPIVGSEEQANDLIHYIKEGQSTEDGVWGTSIFGKSIGELMEDGIRSKIGMMDDESQMKLQDTMQKVVNDNNGGLVCIII